MNGGQDLGGVMGFGPINPEIDEPCFHAEWERRVLAITLAMGGTGTWNIDTSRHIRENVSPASYLTWSYYQIWLEGLEKLLIKYNLATEEEISSGKVRQPPAPINQVLLAQNVTATLTKGALSSRPAKTKPGFRVGDLVKTRNFNPQGHTRLARYLRGHTGTIIEIHGCHVFPDESANGVEDRPQWLYCVQFDAKELWGDDARQGDHIHADLWEPYFEPVERIN